MTNTQNQHNNNNNNHRNTHQNIYPNNAYSTHSYANESEEEVDWDSLL
jgi:hypothetical protein